MLDPTLIDNAIIEQLARDTSPESIPMMMQAFVNEMNRRHTQVEQALDTQDGTLLAKEAHTLKSCAATFGAIHVTLLANQIDQLCKHDHWQHAFQAAQLLPLEMRRVSDYIKTYYQLE